MRICVLSRNSRLYSTRRLVEAARERGHLVSVLDTMAVAVRIGWRRDGRPPQLSNELVDVDVAADVDGVDGIHDGRPSLRSQPPSLVKRTETGLHRIIHLPAVDAIIPRIGASVTAYGLAVVRQFEAAGVTTTATSQAIASSRDKLQSMQLLSEAGLPVPQTAVLAHPDVLFAAVEAVGGLPVIIKLVQGTQGRGVVLARYMSTVAAVLERVRSQQRQVLVQEFIEEAGGSDIRLIVVGNRCVAAMERHAPAGEFRSNLHLGGTGTAIVPEQSMTELAIRAAEVHGLEVAGVDLIVSRRGPLVLEVNSSPGLEGIERVTGIDVAGAIVALVERKVAKGNYQQKRRSKRRAASKSWRRRSEKR